MERPDLTFIDTWPAGMYPNDMVSFEQLQELVAYTRSLEVALRKIAVGWRSPPDDLAEIARSALPQEDV